MRIALWEAEEQGGSKLTQRQGVLILYRRHRPALSADDAYVCMLIAALTCSLSSLPQTALAVVCSRLNVVPRVPGGFVRQFVDVCTICLPLTAIVLWHIMFNALYVHFWSAVRAITLSIINKTGVWSADAYIIR